MDCFHYVTYSNRIWFISIKLQLQTTVTPARFIFSIIAYWFKDAICTLSNNKSVKKLGFKNGNWRRRDRTITLIAKCIKSVPELMPLACWSIMGTGIAGVLELRELLSAFY